MDRKQLAKYAMAAIFGSAVCLATLQLIPTHKPNENALRSPSNHVEFLKFYQARVAADIVRNSLRRDGLDVVIGSDDSLNAVLILADQPTTDLAVARIRHLDSHSPMEIKSP